MSIFIGFGSHDGLAFLRFPMICLSRLFPAFIRTKVGHFYTLLFENTEATNIL